MKTTKLRTALTAACLALAPLASAPFASAQAAPATVADIAMGSADHTTLVAAVKAADLVGALQGAGPITVFGPTNTAFAKLPAGTVETLLKPENKATLAKILTYHVVAGKVSAADLIGLIQKGMGKATVTTLSGGKLTAMLVGGKVVLTDEKGGKATVVATDLAAGNGLVHVTDAVSLPN